MLDPEQITQGLHLGGTVCYCTRSKSVYTFVRELFWIGFLVM